MNRITFLEQKVASFQHNKASGKDPAPSKGIDSSTWDLAGVFIPNNQRKKEENSLEKTIYGSIYYRNKSYPFFLEGDRVNIVGQAWQYQETFCDIGEEETISGVTSDNQHILFLKCKGHLASLRQKAWFCISGYILSRGNTGASYDFNFEKVSFYGDALNAFCLPQQALKTDSDPCNWDSQTTIEKSPLKATTISFGYKECICKLDIPGRVSTQPGKADITHASSSFSFEFSTPQPCVELIQYWLALSDFLSFINYGTDISFDKIILSSRNSNGSFVLSADACILSDEREYLLRSQINRITIDDIPSEQLGALFSKIADLRKTDSRINNYFPRNYIEEIYITPNQWLVKAMTFEGLFKKCYPNFKQDTNHDFQVAKQAVLNALNEVDQGQMSKRQCNYFTDCINQIKHYEGRLEEMLNSTVNKYQEPLHCILDFNDTNHHINRRDYGSIYSKYRNKIAHGDIERIGDKEIAVYRVLQSVIYFMLLEGVELDTNTLQGFANKLFLLRSR